MELNAFKFGSNYFFWAEIKPQTLVSVLINFLW